MGGWCIIGHFLNIISTSHSSSVLHTGGIPKAPFCFYTPPHSGIWASGRLVSLETGITILNICTSGGRAQNKESRSKMIDERRHAKMRLWIPESERQRQENAGQGKYLEVFKDYESTAKWTMRNSYPTVKWTPLCIRLLTHLVVSSGNNDQML